MENIFNVNIGKSVKKTQKITVGYLAHGAEVSIPVLVIKGKKDGPTLWINGLVHGDELNGSIAGWEMFHELNPEYMEGNIIITPVSNPLALADRKKISDIDNIDMDTVFPGNPDGLFSQRIAFTIFEEIKKNADFVLNMHTLGTPYQAVPYTVSKIVPNVSKDIIKKSQEMALSFGVMANCSVDLETASGELPGVTQGALDIECMRNGIPAFMAEVGAGGLIQEEFVDIAKQGIRNLLTKLGIINDEIKQPTKQILITERKFLRATSGGITKLFVNPGDFISDKARLSLTHFFGEDSISTSINEKSFVIAIRKNPVVNTGDRLAFVGKKWTEIKHN